MVSTNWAEQQADDVDAHGHTSSGWTFLTNHAHVLVALARDPRMRLRDVALLVGITERSVQSIVADLEAADYLRRAREGRRNRYEVNPAGPFRHPAERDHAVGELLELFTDDTAGHGGSAERRL
ncbi:winged helix-turn-helix domain-containing protein [Actinomycetospora lemnae]|uniref:Winged helix-turn-helix domain-containing protein n=1 Tax=Actinomycetospora lemnae TaxID=3019891 RepID=A0ABT5SRJ3_9PSEU|nr:winged helix-turn-helix domain-containing protein [Actinomycetospora sp. DW7H6]MDD7965455.1 winged helix-turn-helix domain-containing protein [Actinomycetospora sp. DW7H6]